MLRRITSSSSGKMTNSGNLANVVSVGPHLESLYPWKLTLGPCPQRIIDVLPLVLSNPLLVWGHWALLLASLLLLTTMKKGSRHFTMSSSPVDGQEAKQSHSALGDSKSQSDFWDQSTSTINVQGLSPYVISYHRRAKIDDEWSPQIGWSSET